MFKFYSYIIILLVTSFISSCDNKEIEEVKQDAAIIALEVADKILHEELEELKEEKEEDEKDEK